MALEKRGVGVEVLGVPNLLSNDRTIDKLLIHFLRPRNGGGEVRRVIYPTRVTGQALVIYDEPDDALRVLQNRHHELEIQDKKFPLEVKPVDRPELDLPVEATVNLSMIDDWEASSRLMHMHGFEIIARRGGQVRVKGSMMMLRSFKAEIQKLLEAQTSNLTRPSSSSSSSSLGQSMSPPGADSRNSTNGSSAQAQQNQWRSTDSRSLDSPSPTPSSPSSSSLSAIGPVDSRQKTHWRSCEPRSLDSPSPTPSSSSSSLSAIGPVDSRHPPPKTPPTAHFVVPSEVLDYAQRLKKLGVDDILASHGVDMEAVAIDTEVSEVYVTGRGARSAVGALQQFLSDLQTTLRARQIRVGDLDHEGQVGVAKRIQELKDDYPSVLIRQMGGAVHLIGPRSSCDALKERVMQPWPAEWQPAESGRSREKERSQERSTTPKRRSRSVPRNMSGARSGEELEGEAAAKLASLDGGRSWQRARDHGGQGAALTPEVRGQRGRSNSVTRTSAKPEKTTNHVSPERTNSKPATGPVLKASLFSNLNIKKKSWKF